MRVLTLPILAAVLLAAAPHAADPPQIVLRDVRIVHGDDRITARASVAIAGGRISAIGPLGPVAAGARVIDGRGLTVMPGLIDAHVHVEPWAPPLFLKYGVTAVRDLHNDPGVIFPLARDDSPLHPRIVAAGALLDGPGSFWPGAVIVSSVGEARTAVRRQIEAGAGVIKVYTRLRPALITVIAQEAQARGVPVAAHVGRATAVEAAEAGITSLEHLSGVADAASSEPDRLLKAHDDFLGGWTAFEREWTSVTPAALERVAQRLLARRVTLVPTLALHEAFSRLADADLRSDPALADVPRDVIENAWDPADIMSRAKWTPATLAEFRRALPVMQRFVRLYWQMGGRVAAGTDTAQQFVVPGASLHRELALYVGAGLPPSAAIRSATLDAATLLGIADRVGTVEVGKEADLVLVEGDPLSRIDDTRRIRLVLRGGVIVGEY